MQKVCWRFIQEMDSMQPNTLIKCVGVVLSVTREIKFLSVVVSDMTSSIEASLYEDEKTYCLLDIPQIGESIVLLGRINKKELSSESQILKLKIKTFRKIQPLQEFIIYEQILAEYGHRKQQQQAFYPTAPKTKRPLIKELVQVIEPVDIRTLILSCVYITLENNSDLQSYIFSTGTIQKHRLTKSFLEAKKLKEQSLDYLPEFIEQGLQYLMQQTFIQIKEQRNDINSKLYKITRKKYTDIEMRTIGMINNRKDMGVTPAELVVGINGEYGFLNGRNFVFNDNFIQRILKKFVQEGKIYRSSDGRLYPNV